MSTYNARPAVISDLPYILELQSEYLITNLSEEEKQHGFVTTPFTMEQLKQLLKENGLFVALHDTKIVGYVIAASWQYFSQWPIFPFMSARFPQLNFKGEAITDTNSFQYGPVCIDMEHRGQDILQLLFDQIQLHFNARYPLGGTFINKKNLRSFAAHTNKLKFTVIDEFEFNNNQYWTLAFHTSVHNK